MDDKVTKLADKSNNGFMSTPEDVLNDAIKEYQDAKRGAFEKGKKVLVLALDDTDGNFSVNFIQAGMTMSQCIALCEVAKAIFLTEMEYIN
jgi:hypothetical protein